MSTETLRLVRDGEKGVWRWGEREIIYPSLHCRHRMTPTLRWAAIRAILMFHFVRSNVTRLPTDLNF